MKNDSIVERLCRLPADFYSGSKSMVQLVAESGINANPAALAVASILTYLTNHSELIEQWLRWSENKRVTSGWYFMRQSGKYVVGFRPNGDILNIAEPELACAEFVVREVKAMMAIHHVGKLHS
jgi:hypothetical protein